MDSIETALRLMVIGQAVLMALVLGSRGPRAMTVPLVMLQISVATYLIKSSPVLSASVPFASVPILIVSVASPFLVWICAKILFEFERPPLWAMIAFPSTVAACVTLQILGDGAAHPFEAFAILASLTVVLHAVYSIVCGSLDDLCEPRRRFRFCFVACIAAVTAFVLTMELVFVGQQPPAWVPMTNVILIATVFLAISLPLITRPGDLLPDDPSPKGSKSSELAPVDQQTHSALVRAMENRAYARTGLTIRQLAEELRVPEHHLRTLINQRLGYKNFSSFLNGYRIDETCARLRDVNEARIPILTIALDAGFASLAPFNRAFRQSTGMTPSEYRRQELQSGAVVTPIHGLSQPTSTMKR